MQRKFATTHIGNDIYGVSESFQFGFENSGYMTDSLIYTCKTMPVKIKPKVMRDIMQDNITMQVDEHYYIPDGRLYYTDIGATKNMAVFKRWKKTDSYISKWTSIYIFRRSYQYVG